MSMSKWAEIRTDFVDDDDNFLRVDAWKTDTGDEEGEVIAYIDTLSGRIIYADPDAITDEYAQEEIMEASERYKKEHPYSVTELEYFCKKRSRAFAGQLQRRRCQGKPALIWFLRTET